MDLMGTLQLHTRETGIRGMSIHCRCGWSTLGLSPNLFLQHQSDVISELVSGWIELFCQEVSQSLISYVNMIELNPDDIGEVIESMRDQALNYAERAQEVRGDGTL